MKSLEEGEWGGRRSRFREQQTKLRVLNSREHQSVQNFHRMKLKGRTKKMWKETNRNLFAPGKARGLQLTFDLKQSTGSCTPKGHIAKASIQEGRELNIKEFTIIYVEIFLSFNTYSRLSISLFRKVGCYKSKTGTLLTLMVSTKSDQGFA